MMGKPMTGKSFGGCIRYVVDKQEAKILVAEGVRMQSALTLTQDFNLHRRMRSELGKAVGHLVLSWSKEDLPKLSDEIMVERAKEYMEKMGIRDTQYVVVRHSDRQNPHVHVVYNRVDHNGKTISDQNSYARNIKACKEITLKYGYHLGKGKDEVNRLALRGKEKIRYELYDAIKAAIKTSANWKALEARLQHQGIGIAYKYRSGSSEVQGISFEKGDIKMKGSAIDRSLSFTGIDRQLNLNQQAQQSAAGKPSLADQLREAISGSAGTAQPQSSENGLLDILQQLEFTAGTAAPADDGDILKRKRKKHEAEQARSRRMSR